jgi:hypothetical protein
MARWQLAAIPFIGVGGLALAAAALAGCGADLAGDSQETTGDAVASANGLAAINGLAATNGLAASNGLALSNGLAGTNGLAATNGLMTTAAGRNTVAYLVRCALPAWDSLVKQDQNGTSYTFQGQIGVAPQWKTGACDSTCQENVSACMMAHVNTSGRHVALWLDGTSPAIGWGRSPSYPMQESAFFGNIFTPSAPKAFFCNGFDWDRGPVAGRIGANQVGSPYTNPFGTNALCQGRCAPAGYLGQEYGSCAGFNNVVTVYRDFDPTTAFNVCNGQNGLCFQIANKSLSAGAALQQGTRNGNENQKFFLERISADSDSGKYRVRAKMSSLYLSVAGGSTGNGAGIVQMPWTGGGEQQWWLVQIVGSSYLFANVQSGHLLDSVSATVADPIVQNGGGGYSPDQMWRIMIAQ